MGAQEKIMDTIWHPNLPRIDLHRHLDGNVRLQTILDLGKHYGLDLPAWEVDALRPHVQVSEKQPGVMAFIARFRWMLEVMVDYEAIERIAFENVEDAYQEGLDYVELRFSPWFMAERHGLDPVKVVEAVCRGVERGRRQKGMPVNLIGIISRTYGPDIGWHELEALLSHKDQIVALDLAGDEANFPASLFIEHFAEARRSGWQVTVHAGEIAGAESIWQAIERLGATRIGHAVAALDDASLMAFMREHRIGIETNITSNVQTSTVADYAQHPIRRFLEAGLLATINTDDPGISGITLHDEYEVAYRQVGLSLEQIHQAQRNALEIAFLSQEEKRCLLAKRLDQSGA